MVNSPLEFLASQYGHVVKYDASGNPSIFVKFPKMKSSNLDASLPEHTHPAFIINGVEQDYILIGKYKAASLTGSGSDNGTLYSLPNMPPAHTRTADDFLAQLRAFGNGVSGMTVADRGFLLLLAQKNGWNPGGNSDFGHCYKDGTRYELGKAVKVGDKRLSRMALRMPDRPYDRRRAVPRHFAAVLEEAQADRRHGSLSDDA